MRKLLILLIFSLFGTGITGQDTLPFDERLDALITSYEEVFGFSGTVKVVIGEKEAFEKSYGLADRSFEIPNTPATRNSINSISKTFTAVAILSLVQEGKIDIASPLGRYLPQLDASWKDSVTIHHLLTHSSGLPRESGIQPHDELSLAEQLPLVEGQQLLFTPGEKYEYSNSGVILLGAVLEQVSGQDYHEIIEDRIITPLQLKNTGVYQGRNVVSNQAVPYRLGSNGLEFQQRSKHYGENAGGGLYSTVSDLYKYVLALENNILLPDSLTQLLFAPHLQSGEREYEGYLWSIKYFGDEKIHFAAGSGYGTKSVLIRSPDSKDFIAITSNWGNTPILDLLRDLYLLTKGQPVKPPTSDQLAKPENYRQFIGQYAFDEHLIKQHLQSTESVLSFQAFDDKLFLGDELMAEKAAGKLGLTYTDELLIYFENDRMILEINGNSLAGKKLPGNP